MVNQGNKFCPRCGQLFECIPGNITECHCYGILLTEEEKKGIEQNYKDCLCANCLLCLKNGSGEQAKPLTLPKN